MSIGVAPSTKTKESHYL